METEMFNRLREWWYGAPTRIEAMRRLLGVG
jgi:hypothetical protein